MLAVFHDESPSVDQLRCALSYLVDTVRDIVDQSKRGPTMGSRGRREWDECARLPAIDGSPWAKAPWRNTLNGAHMQLDTVVEYVSSVCALLSAQPLPILAIDALTRSAVEAAAQAWWLLTPDIGGRRRVARFYALGRQSSAELLRACERMGIDPTVGLSSHLDSIRSYAVDTLGLREDFSKKNNWQGYEMQIPEGPTVQAARFFSDIGRPLAGATYAYLCGATHAEAWRTELAYPIADNASLDISTRMHNSAYLQLPIATCSEVLLHPSYALLALYGRFAAANRLARAASDMVVLFPRDSVRAA